MLDLANNSPAPSAQIAANNNFGDRSPDGRATGDHLLCGAAELAEHILGDRERARTIYHWFEHGLIPPAFKVGKTICASKAALNRWMRGEDGPSVRVQTNAVLWPH